jgi:hypothetical protein
MDHSCCVFTVYLSIDYISAAVLLVIGIIAGITLFYHGNGYSQVGMQRFTLDWLPLLMVLMGRTPRPAAYAALPVLAVWGMTLTVIIFGLRAWLKMSAM